MQAGHACFCGARFGSQGKAPSEAACNVTCTGDSHEDCGGLAFNGVWRVLNHTRTHAGKGARGRE